MPASKIELLLVAFGTTREHAHQLYDNIEQTIRQAHPELPMHWAYTSPRIRAALAKEGLHVDSPQEAISKASQRGVKALIVQSLLVTPGQEFSRLQDLQAPAGLDLILAPPLINSRDDMECIIRAIANDFHPDWPSVVICHGNDNFEHFNETNLSLASHIEKSYPTVTVASVEGLPGPAPLKNVRPIAHQKGGVHFVPMLMVDGMHVRVDVMGDGPDSWKNQIAAPQTTVAPPLAANPAVVRLILQHLDDTMPTAGINP